ncbi:MAG: hypothetical protein Kow0077_21730 [Anaerolineae bacterium]
MTIPVYWLDNAQTIMVADFPALWTLEQFKAMRQQVIALARSVDHQIVVILNGEKSQQIPPNFIPYAGMLIRERERPITNVRAYFIVTHNRLIRTMYEAFVRVQGTGTFGNRLFLVSTLEEARQAGQKYMHHFTQEKP